VWRSARRGAVFLLTLTGGRRAADGAPAAPTPSCTVPS
jgi:hypothetical protein